VDRRLTPVNGRVADIALQGQVEAEQFVTGAARRVIVPVADVFNAPSGKRDRQVLMGWTVRVYEERNGFAFCQSDRDGYVGYIRLDALGPTQVRSHWVSTAATHIYTSADFKEPEQALLSLGAEVLVVAEHERFYEIAEGGFIPRQHLSPLTFRFDDPAHVANLLIGSPYLWGGNSRSGLDCSALVQAAFQACGIDCPGDSDMQERQLAPGRPMGNTYQRNDLLFWNGHVALALDDTTLIHANAGHMAVAHEGIEEAIKRIEAQGDGPVTARIRV